MIVDESHVTFPQVRAMYAGDRSRKDSLVAVSYTHLDVYKRQMQNYDPVKGRVG